MVKKNQVRFFHLDKCQIYIKLKAVYLPIWTSMVEALTLEQKPALALKPVLLQIAVAALGQVFQDPLNPDFGNPFASYARAVAKRGHSRARAVQSLAITPSHLSELEAEEGLTPTQRITLARVSIPVEYGLLSGMDQLASWMVSHLPVDCDVRGITPITLEERQAIDRSFSATRKNLATMAGITKAGDEFFHARLDQIPPVGDAHYLKRMASLLEGDSHTGDYQAKDVWGIQCAYECLLYRQERNMLTPPQVSILRKAEDVMARLGFKRLDEVRDLVVGRMAIADEQWGQLFTEKIDRGKVARAVAKAKSNPIRPVTSGTSEVLGLHLRKVQPQRADAGSLVFPTLPGRADTAMPLIYQVSDQLIAQRAWDLRGYLVGRGVVNPQTLGDRIDYLLRTELSLPDIVQAMAGGGRRRSQWRLLKIIDGVINSGGRVGSRQLTYTERKNIEKFAQRQRDAYANLVPQLSAEEINKLLKLASES